jgi:hypothetical protein
MLQKWGAVLIRGCDGLVHYNTVSVQECKEVLDEVRTS